MNVSRSPLPLQALQGHVLDVLYGGVPDDALVGAVRGRGGLAPASLLAIYRNATQATLTNALRISYPLVEHLVGAAFFDEAARTYLAGTPSQSGDLEQYGADFGAFLGRYEPATGCAPLPDVAGLEWLIAQLRRAPPQSVLDRGQLAVIPQEVLGALRVTLSSRAALYQSRYPCFRLWQDHQCHLRETAGFPLEESPERLLIVAQDAIVGCPVPKGDFAFYRTCVQGGTLTEAFDAGMAECPGFDVVGAIARALDLGVLRIDPLQSTVRGGADLETREPT